MAKTKKKTRAKGKQSDSDVWGKAVSQTLAAVLIFGSICIFLGGLGFGGRLPELLFEGLSQVLGRTSAFLIPFIIGYLAWVKFSVDNKQLPRVKILSGSILILSISIMLDVVGTETAVEFQGGHIGDLVGNFLGHLLSRPLSFVLMLFSSLLSLSFLINVEPKTLIVKLIDFVRAKPLIKTKPSSETTSIRLNNSTSKFKINQSIPAVSQKKEPIKTTNLTTPSSTKSKAKRGSNDQS